MEQQSQLSQENHSTSPLKLQQKQLLLALLFLTLAGVLAAYLQFKPAVLQTNTTTPQIVSLSVADTSDRQKRSLLFGPQTLSVEIVQEPASIELGLSGRSEIGSDGMLFIMPLRQTPAFWMKEMQFDLDMVWIDGDTVIGVTTNVPAPTASTPLSELPHFRPPGPVTAVLELPAGDAERRGIQKGSVVQILQ